MSQMRFGLLHLLTLNAPRQFKHVSRNLHTIKRNKSYLNSTKLGSCQFSNLLNKEICDLNDTGSTLEIKLNTWPTELTIPYIWLRDHCRCNVCYNKTTNQRNLDICNVPLDIKPSTIQATPKGLELIWPDGHKSEYEFDFLWKNSYEGKEIYRKSSQILWNSKNFPSEEEISATFSDVKNAESNLKKVVESIVKYGVGMITEVSPNEEATREAIELVADVKKTFFGEMWFFTADDMQHADTAYTNEALGAHTDNTYFSQASRLQVFHCLKAAPDGGETLLVDGFEIADQFKKQHPKGYEFLSSKAIPSFYIESGQHHYSQDYVFKHHNNTNRLKQFRYNIYDRAPLSSLPYGEIQDFYFHLKNLTQIVRNKENEKWIALTPGKVLFIDNWRVMHGRAAFRGLRIMGGCYIDHDDFTSKARVLGLDVD